MGQLNCIILAAGDGKRMKSRRPKVLMELLFSPMLEWVLDAATKAGVTDISVVTGAGSDEVEAFLSEKNSFVKTFFQAERKGTGHAVMQAASTLNDSEHTLVLFGDSPFMDEKTICDALEQHLAEQNKITLITTKLDNPTGYGRILRSETGAVIAIREEKDCTPEERSVKEINSGAMWFQSAALKEALEHLNCDNASGEYYLTDTVSYFVKKGERVDGYCAQDPVVALGANDRKALLRLNEIARFKVIDALLDEGVEFPCTDGIIIGKNVKIGQDTVILPGTILKGNTQIGNSCVIGPNSLLQDCTVGSFCHLNNLQAFEAKFGNYIKAGPFAHIRKGTTIADGVKIGDFVEIKNSFIGEKTSVAHLTYLGDSNVGRGVNFGCGCVTANYDGINKYRTIIGDNAFLGCNTNLIAPVIIGENASTAAGSTITKNVPENALAIERGEQKIIENWERNKLRKKK